ncbi:hypothetical protein GS905_23950 [Rhodococcus hoagii]|nr:hypothetical protein [Prescottella equi]NKU71360.1 hypothetical protein [Prescottella equi]
MTNDVLADINRQTRERLVEKAHDRVGQLADLLAHERMAASIIGSLRSLIELLRDTNSDDVPLDMCGMANRLDIHALELAAADDYEGAKLAIETAEALCRRQDQIDASAFREPHVDRGSIR